MTCPVCPKDPSHKQCPACGGVGFSLSKGFNEETCQIEAVRNDCASCNGFGILMSDGSAHKSNGQGYRKMRSYIC